MREGRRPTPFLTIFSGARSFNLGQMTRVRSRMDVMVAFSGLGLLVIVKMSLGSMSKGFQVITYKSFLFAVPPRTTVPSERGMT